MDAEPRTLPVKDLGRAGFASVHARMLEVADRVRKHEQPSQVWLVEHEPVFTAGRGARRADLTVDAVPVERGGQLTYHGPGQLVVYPIVELGTRDARAWLRALESFGIAVCARFGVVATGSGDGTGVFVGGRKVASIGVAIRRWVAFHGLALNVAMDLAPFHAIRPCGLAPEVMVDLSTLLKRPVDLAEAKAHARAEVSLLAAAAGCA